MSYTIVGHVNVNEKPSPVDIVFTDILKPFETRESRSMNPIHKTRRSIRSERDRQPKPNFGTLLPSPLYLPSA